MKNKRTIKTELRKIDEDGDSQTKDPSRYEDELDQRRVSVALVEGRLGETTHIVSSGIVSKKIHRSAEVGRLADWSEAYYFDSCGEEPIPELRLS